MRWTAKPPRKKHKPADGDERTVHRLLLWPVCLDGEWRWLEWNYILQRFDDYMACASYKQRRETGWTDAHWN